MTRFKNYSYLIIDQKEKRTGISIFCKNSYLKAVPLSRDWDFPCLAKFWLWKYIIQTRNSWYLL